MSLRRLLTIVMFVALCVPSLVFAQTYAPKYEVFGGYSYYNPQGDSRQNLPEFDKGWAAQFAYNFNHWFGIAFDAAGHYKSDYDGNAHSFAVGPQFKLRRHHFVPFGEALFGAQMIGPSNAPTGTDFVIIAGGGLDIPITRHFGIRAGQVDYVYSRYNELQPAGNWTTLNGFRAQGGVTFSFGGATPQKPVSAACTADPQAVDAGVPVQIGVTPAGFLPKRVLTYSYASTGGKITGTDNMATVDTTGLAAGSYTVTGKVMDNGKGKHQQIANCTVGFSVNEPKHPPVLSLSANPDSLKCGEPSTISASGSSADNRPLTYNCNSSAGRLSGNGPTYTLDTTGVPSGTTITVNCTVSDDRQLTASASTRVSCVAPPPPPPAPTASKFGAIEFKHDVKRPTRVDNEAKGELDRYADALAAAPDAKGVVVGQATAAEKTPKKGSKRTPDFPAERAVNTKDYLTKEKGVDASRVEPRTGTDDDQRTDLWVVPAGANFPAEGTQAVNEAKVKAVPRVAAPVKKTTKK
ncbi:MAG: hypothetical protein CXZ00_10430 [Acidobacteria bacterium]|nr:MAG: hypothetical protein CXZ00_10430 [Acidobacteriota bacterium]